MRVMRKLCIKRMISKLKETPEKRELQGSEIGLHRIQMSGETSSRQDLEGKMMKSQRNV